MSESDKSIPNEIIEFQPDALEIKNQRLPGFIRFGVWFPFVVLVAVIIWASLCKTDVVIVGNGKLVTNQSTIVMKPLERSVVKEVHVHIGDVVHKDQVLVTFDPTINKAEAEHLKNEMRALEAQLERLKAEFNGIEYKGTDEQFSSWQQAIFLQRQKYYESRMKYFKESLEEVDSAEKTRRDALEKHTERLDAMKELEEMYKKLRSQDVASQRELLQMSISRMEMEATVDQLRNDMQTYRHKKGSIEAEKNSFIQDWRNRISEEMVTVERNLVTARQEYEKVAQLIEYVQLKSPCNAVVHEIASFPTGSAVREAEALITLVPLDDNLEIEAEIRPDNIGKIKVGSTARIKLSAYPFQKYGTLDGVVRNISEDTLENMIAGQSVKYYRARLTLSGKLHGVPDTFRLIPGMEAQCEIKCDRRRIIEYVLHPLIKAFDETAREP